MKIEYAGPRPIISQHGVQFKDGKEDKYVYLMISIQILQAIDKNYEGHKSYSYDSSKQYPVVLWFHWWGDDFTTLPYIYNEDVISVYPVGMSDYQR